jgi:hypothetical protein
VTHHGALCNVATLYCCNKQLLQVGRVGRKSWHCTVEHHSTTATATTAAARLQQGLEAIDFSLVMERKSVDVNACVQKSRSIYVCTVPSQKGVDE